MDRHLPCFRTRSSMDDGFILVHEDLIKAGVCVRVCEMHTQDFLSVILADLHSLTLRFLQLNH